MVIKINYTSSDIYVSTNVSPVYVVVNYSGTSDTNAVWGQITGTLSNQTDLQNALNAKFDDPTGTTSQYLRGDGTLATFPTITSGTVTSVGLTMPSAFAVANSPVTSSGTLAVTGAGTADQYVRGDGQLANFPTNGGGGSSVNYYLNGSVSQGTFGGDTYYEMSKTPIAGAGTNFTRTNAQGNGYIASFITDAGDPALLNIPGGNWNIEFYFQASSGGGNPSFYAELYKVSSSNVFTLIGSGSTNPEGITNGTAVDQYFTSIPVPQTALLATDRIAIRIFVTPSGRTITLHTENSNLCEVLTTFSTGLNALNGLTAQVQYFATGTSGTDFAISSATDTHTFNIPTASGTNRGALSSADWTTFSGKVGGSGATGQVAYWNGTNSQTGSNNLFWDAANARLGIGTNSPSTTLDIRGKTRIESTSNCEFDFINGSNIVRLALSATTGFVGTLTSLPFAFFTAATRRGEFSINGNFLIGNTTDGGQRLQVYGDAFIKGSGATSATTALTVQNSSAQTLFSVKNNGQTTLTGTTNNDTTNIFRIEQQNNNGRFLVSASGQTQIVGDSFQSSESFVRLERNAFNPTSGGASHTTLLIESTINQTGGANGITRGLYVNPTLTAAADWRSIEWSNNSGWGLYGAGTAYNYLASRLGIGTTSPSSALHVVGTINATNVQTPLVFSSGGDSLTLATQGGTSAITIFPTTRNVLIQNAGVTADAGYRLDVNGTARVSGATGTILTLNSTNGTGYSAIKIDASGVEKALIGFGNYLTTDGGVAIRTAASTPFTIAIGGGVPTLTLAASGAATFSSSVTAASYTVNDAGNITVGTTTGTKIGTAASQKLSFWNATPIVQPTSAVAAATFVANTSLIMNDTATFDGYTIGQVVKALRNAGLLA